MANEPRVKIIGKKGPYNFDSGDSAFYSEYSEDSDMAIPGNTAFNQMQYVKKQKKAKAKAAEQKKKTQIGNCAGRTEYPGGRHPRCS